MGNLVMVVTSISKILSPLRDCVAQSPLEPLVTVCFREFVCDMSYIHIGQELVVIGCFSFGKSISCCAFPDKDRYFQQAGDEIWNTSAKLLQFRVLGAGRTCYLLSSSTACLPTFAATTNSRALMLCKESQRRLLRVKHESVRREHPKVLPLRTP